MKLSKSEADLHEIVLNVTKIDIEAPKSTETWSKILINHFEPQKHNIR